MVAVRTLVRRTIGALRPRRADLAGVPARYHDLVRRIQKNSPIWGAHQTIEFPDGFVLKGGRDRSRFDVFDLPANMAGQSVLDIGCNLGAISLECRQRGARVRGLDYNAELVQCASEVAAAFGIKDIDYRVLDLRADRLGGRYDHVFFLNVFHHLDEHTRLQVLRDLDRVTTGTLYFEAPVKDDLVAREAVQFPVEDYVGYLTGFTNFPKIEVLASTDFGRPLIRCSR